MHLGGGGHARRQQLGRQLRPRHGTSPATLRGYRDDEGHYGLTHAPGMMGGNAGMGGMNRYGSDYDRGRMEGDRGGMDYDRGYKTRQQTDAGDPFGDRQAHTPIRMTGGGRGGMNRYDRTIATAATGSDGGCAPVADRRA